MAERAPLACVASARSTSGTEPRQQAIKAVAPSPTAALTFDADDVQRKLA